MPFFGSTDQAIATFIVIAIMLLVAFPIHEFSHALAAFRLGDGTARLFGRLTLNPIAHFDPFGGLILIASMVLSGGGFGFGWAKPTPVNPLNLRGGRSGEAIVAFAGPASNLVLAVAGALPLRYMVAAHMDIPILEQVLFTFVFINVLLMLFNLVPIPPLDGSRVLFSLLSPRAAWRWRPVLQQYGPILLLVAVFFPILPGGETIFAFVFRAVATPILGLLLGSDIVG